MRYIDIHAIKDNNLLVVPSTLVVQSFARSFNRCLIGVMIGVSDISIESYSF